MRRFWLLAVLCCSAAVLTLTHLPQDPTPRVLREGAFHFDKIEHVLAYGAVCACVMLAARRCSRRWVVVMLLVVITAAMCDEMTQPIVGRNASVGDFIADALGAVLATVAVLFKRRREAQRRAAALLQQQARMDSIICFDFPAEEELPPYLGEDVAAESELECPV